VTRNGQAYITLVGQDGAKRLVEIHGCKLEDNTEIDFGECMLDSLGSIPIEGKDFSFRNLVHRSFSVTPPPIQRILKVIPLV
jgi:hypothetical protein